MKGKRKLRGATLATTDKNLSREARTRGVVVLGLVNCA